MTTTSTGTDRAVTGVLGEKLGMTQVWDADNRLVPVTVIKAGPCVVTQIRTPEKDGYAAVQIGLVEKRAPKHVTKPMKGHFEKAGLPPCRVLREFRVEEGAEVKVGDKISVELFAAGDDITVIGISKGKGFQGVVKRHHFRGGAATHGSMFHRAPGSIGASAFPSRVLKGMRAAGHMGTDRVTVKNLKVVKVDPANNVLVVKGSVPGSAGGYVVVRKG